MSDPQESRPEVSHEVIATYVADAAQAVPGVAELHATGWRGLSSRVREDHAPGVVVREAPEGLEVEVHIKVAWGVSIPEVAQQIENDVRTRATALLGLEFAAVTIFVDAIEEPLEARRVPES